MRLSAGVLVLLLVALAAGCDDDASDAGFVSPSMQPESTPPEEEESSDQEATPVDLPPGPLSRYQIDFILPQHLLPDVEDLQLYLSGEPVWHGQQTPGVSAGMPGSVRWQINQYELSEPEAVVDVFWPDGQHDQVMLDQTSPWLQVIHPSLVVLPAEALRQQAVSRLFDYFSDYQYTLDEVSLVVLMMVEAVFGRSPGIDVYSLYMDHYVQAQLRGDALAVLAMDGYRRLFDAEHGSVALDYTLLPTTDRVTLAALYCDREPLPSDFSGILLEMSGAGGYWATHAYLALWWALIQGCDTGLAPGQQANFIDQLQHIAFDRPEGMVGDLQIEAMLFLLASGWRGEDELYQWLEDFWSSQKEDGGWSYTGVESESLPHSSVLAWWLLSYLEQTNRFSQPLMP